MGTISKTLSEVLEIPGYNLFLPHDILEYDHLQFMICQKFYNREISYDTVDYFRYRLNYYLELNAPRYNKLLESELVDFDPFMSDYRERSVGEQVKSSSQTGESMSQGKSSGRRTSNRTHFKDNELYEGKENQTNFENTVGTDVAGRLNSTAENAASDREFTEHKDYTEHKEHSKQNITDRDYTEHKTSNETTDHTIDRTNDRTIDRKSDRSQTSREWTERGSSKGHNIDVNSDTPQAMLFNTPNHYYGTGTADEMGIVSGDVYTPYLEDDIEALDTQPRAINGGDTPWFNYASSAGNRLAHDNYDRSGTEKYAVNQADHDTDNYVFNETGNKSVDYTEDKQGTEDITETEGYNEDISGNHDIKDNESKLESKTTNTNEHEKSDSTETRKGMRDGRNAHEKNIDRHNWFAERDSRTEQMVTGRSAETTADNHRDIRETYRGRFNRSPSKLLDEYRSTVLFSADEYMLSQLEACFLQVF